LSTLCIKGLTITPPPCHVDPANQRVSAVPNVRQQFTGQARTVYRSSQCLMWNSLTVLYKELGDWCFAHDQPAHHGRVVLTVTHVYCSLALYARTDITRKPWQFCRLAGASPGQTNWGGQYGWSVGRVSLPKSGGRVWGYNLKLFSTLHNDSIPETPLGKKWRGRVHPSPPRGNAPLDLHTHAGSAFGNLRFWSFVFYIHVHFFTQSS